MPPSGGVDEKLGGRKLRRMGRLAEWQNKYTVAKTNNLPLFSGSVSTWNGWQVFLAYWCDFYYNVFRMPRNERPSNDVIEDDFKLDNFLRQKQMAREHELSVQSAEAAAKRSSGLVSVFKG